MAGTLPQTGLAPPPGDKLRGAYFRWLFFAAGPLEAAVTIRMLGFEVPADRRSTAGWGCYDDVLNVLERELTGREFIAGDRFTMADLYVGSHLGWGLQFGSIEPREVFKTYAERMAARPAAIRAGEIDDALIPAA